MMHLGYSVRNTVQQTGAVPIVMKEVGPVKLTQATAHFNANRKELKKEINSKSKFMENRSQLVSREIREAINRVTATGKAQKHWNEFRGKAFIMQITIDSELAYPTWWAAYTTAMEKHGDEKRARIEADDAVGRSVGSGSDLHLGRFYQSSQGELIKTLGMFGSWFNAYYQRLYRSSKGGEDFFNADFAMEALTMPIIVGTLSQLLIGDLPDSDEAWWEYITKNGFYFLLGTLPILREVASHIQGFTPATPLTNIPAAVVRAGQETSAYLDGNQSPLKTVVDLGKAATSVVPVPMSGQVWRILDGVDAVNQGEDPIRPYQIVVEGREKDK